MLSNVDLWSGTLATLLGTVVAFLLGWLPQLLDKRKTRRAHQYALKAEIDSCWRGAKTYLKAGIKVPSYRLSILVYQNCLPKLLADGSLSQQRVDALLTFLIDVDAFNRGLDQAEEYRDTNQRQLGVEVRRIRLKASNILEKYSSAVAAVLP